MTPLLGARLFGAACGLAAALVAYDVEPSPLLAGFAFLLAAYTTGEALPRAIVARAPDGLRIVVACAGAVWLAFYVGLNIDFAVIAGALLAPQIHDALPG